MESRLLSSRVMKECSSRTRGKVLTVKHKYIYQTNLMTTLALNGIEHDSLIVSTTVFLLLGCLDLTFRYVMRLNYLDAQHSRHLLQKSARLDPYCHTNRLTVIQSRPRLLPFTRSLALRCTGLTSNMTLLMANRQVCIHTPTSGWWQIPGIKTLSPLW